jgi:hypothetical protein
MTEDEAEMVAKALRGEPWNSGGGIWLVLFHRADGSITVLGDDAINVYSDQVAFDSNSADESVLLH